VSTSTTRVAGWTLPSVRCFIATAAFGSELSPEVQFLRQFRDETVMSSFGGRMFMTAFNAAYYSFSPSVAAFVAERPWFTLIVRVMIYPLISLLRLTSLVFNGFPVGAEIGVLLYGLLASCLFGLIYLLPIAVVSREVVKREPQMVRSLRKKGVGGTDCTRFFGNSASTELNLTFQSYANSHPRFWKLIWIELFVSSDSVT